MIEIPTDQQEINIHLRKKSCVHYSVSQSECLWMRLNWHCPWNPSVFSCRRRAREKDCSTKDENYCHFPFKIFSTTYCDYLLVLRHELLMHDFVRNHGTDRHTIALILDICVTLRVHEKQDDSITWVSSVQFRKEFSSHILDVVSRVDILTLKSSGSINEFIQYVTPSSWEKRLKRSNFLFLKRGHVLQEFLCYVPTLYFSL